MPTTEDYISENCVECLIGAENCLIFKHVESIEEVLKKEEDTIFNKLGDCKIFKAISVKLRAYIQVGGSGR